MEIVPGRVFKKKCIVENAGALGIQAAKERRPGRAAYWILAKCSVESDRFLGKLGKVGSGDGFVSGGGNMGV